MPKKRKKTKNESSNVTRRDILKGAGAAGAAAVLGPDADIEEGLRPSG
jgi:hypothetical protein